MRRPRLTRTASFKLAALYALIFGVSVVVLAAVVYVISTTALDRQTRMRIHSEAIELMREYHAGGEDALLSAIRRRQRGKLVDGLDYTVYDGSGRRLFGTLPHMAEARGWSQMSGPPDGDEPAGELEQLIVYSEPLDHGGWLMIGDDIGKVEKVGRLIMTTFGWALLVMISFAIAGGAALSAAFLGRIDSITRTAEAIIGGDIRRRMPLRGINDDIDRLSMTLNRMLDRIGELMEALNQVTSDIAHDLRTPLGRLRQELDEARQHPHSIEEYDRVIERALAEADSILETFGAILRIAQIESGSRRAGFRTLDFSRLLSSLVQTYVPVAEDVGSSIELEVAPEIALTGDRELLTQMIVNLLENAIRHAGPGAKIKAMLDRGPDGIRLQIRDNGPGIPADERPAVLRRFYRLERSRTTAGSGLGLSLVAAVAALHGATITLGDNAPGLTVEIVFPPTNAVAEPERA